MAASRKVLIVTNPDGDIISVVEADSETARDMIMALANSDLSIEAQPLMTPGEFYEGLRI